MTSRAARLTPTPLQRSRGHDRGRSRRARRHAPAEHPLPDRLQRNRRARSSSPAAMRCSSSISATSPRRGRCSTPVRDDAVELHLAEADYDESLVAVLSERSASSASASKARGCRSAGSTGCPRRWRARRRDSPEPDGLPRAGPDRADRRAPARRSRTDRDRHAPGSRGGDCPRSPGACGIIVRTGRTELDVAADIDAVMRAAGFERPAFETIVASGPNGALPHARPGQRPLEAGGGGGAGLRGCLRRILRGSHADGAAWGAGRRSFAGCSTAVAEAQRRRSRRSGRASRPSAIDAAARDVLDAARAWARRSGTAPGTGSGSKCTRSRGSRGAVAGSPDAVLAAGHGVHDRAGRLRRRASAACGSKTTCW